jgi:hypothetical protein
LWYEKEEAQHTCPLVAPKPALSIFFPNFAQGQLHHHHNINSLKRGYILKGTDNFSILVIEAMTFSL